MQTFFYILAPIYLTIVFMYSWFEGRKKATGFLGTFLIVFFIPFIGFWIVELLSNQKAKGCKWCGNKYNEAEYCGVCGKNEDAEIRPGFIKR